MKFRLGFGYLSIELSLANAALARPMLNCTSCSVESYLKSSTMLMGWPLITSGMVVEKLADLLNRISSVFWALISRPTLPASIYIILGLH